MHVAIGSEEVANPISQTWVLGVWYLKQPPFERDRGRKVSWKEKLKLT